MSKLWPAVISVILAGCGSVEHSVPDQYRPLERIVESSLIPDGRITTVGTTARVQNLEEWLQKHQPGTPRYHAILLHEQVHSQRQLKAGLASWLNKYLTDRKFMFDEESIGWYTELRALIGAGYTINIAAVANTLSEYRVPLTRERMISYEEAIEWVKKVVDGRWKPEGQ